MPDDGPPPKKRRRWLRRLLIVFGLLAIAAFFFFRDEELKPVDDLLPQRISVAWNDDNGWKRLADFAPGLPSLSDDVQRRLYSVMDYDREPDPAEVKKFTLTDAQLTELESIAAAPQFHDRTYEIEDMDYTYLHGLRRLFQFTLLAAVEENNIPLALRCVRITAALQKRMTGGATHILSYLIGITLFEHEAVARVLLRLQWNETELKELAAILANDPVVPDELQEAMCQEFRRSSNLILSTDGPPEIVDHIFFKTKPPPKFLYQKNRTINLMAEALRLDRRLTLTAPWSEIDRRREQHVEEEDFLPWLDPNLYGKALLGGPLVPASFDSRWRRTNGAQRMLQVLVALHRYHLAHNAPPSSLTALVPDFLPAVPLDPFDFEPLRWHPTLRAVQGTDDNGELLPPGPKQVRPVSSDKSIFLFRTKAEEDARRAALPLLPPPRLKATPRPATPKAAIRLRAPTTEGPSQ